MPFARSLLVAGSFLALVGCEETIPEPDHEPLVMRPSGTAGIGIFETEWGDIVAADSAQARMGAMELRAASAAMFTHFGVRSERGCIRVVNAAASVPECPEGLTWETPWMAADFSDFLAKSKARPALAHQRIVGFGLQSDTPAVRLSHLLGDDERRCRQDQSILKMVTHLRHEIAHTVFTSVVWAKTTPGLTYGGDAPDWLDEAAAMTADVPTFRRSRQSRFTTMIAEDRVIPFEAFLSMEHPSMAEVRTATSPAATKATPQVTITRVDPKDPKEVRSLDYYAQSQVLADFLIASSDNQRILRDLSDSLKNGIGFDDWLQARLGIDAGKDYEGLQAATIQWVSRQDWKARREDQLACGD